MAQSYKPPDWAREARIKMLDGRLKSVDIAHALDVSKQSVAGVLTGNRPNVKLAQRICEYLHIDYEAPR